MDDGFNLGPFVRFCWGFWQKQVAERGFLMVNLWWIDGETWSIDGHFLPLKILHGFRIYFLAFPFWEFLHH